MSIILVEQSDSLPVDDNSWTKLVETDKYYNLGLNNPTRHDFLGDTIKKGVLISIGGSNYQAISDTAISGTASKYVKITPVGANASAEYVPDLTGVSWNDTYNFYNDVSGNAYLFDEMRAIYDGLISIGKTMFGKMTDFGYFKQLFADTLNTGQGDNKLYEMNQNVKTNDGVQFASVNSENVSIKQKLFTGTTESGGNVSITHGIDINKILGVSACVRISTLPRWAVDTGGSFPYEMTSAVLSIPFDSVPGAGSQPYRVLITYEA